MNTGQRTATLIMILIDNTTLAILAVQYKVRLPFFPSTSSGVQNNARGGIAATE